MSCSLKTGLKPVSPNKKINVRKNKQLTSHYFLLHRMQIEAAKRSLKTNIFLGLFLIITLTCLTAVPSAWRAYLNVLYISLFKAGLPILTTVANFGNVKSVVAKYWNNYKDELATFK